MFRKSNQQRAYRENAQSANPPSSGEGLRDGQENQSRVTVPAQMPRRSKFWPLKLLLAVVLTLALIFVLLLGYGTATEYRPADQEALQTTYGAGYKPGEHAIRPGQTLRIMTYNIGYAALDDSQDFFMDGGQSVRPKKSDSIRENMAGILKEVREINADFSLLQEVDEKSRRSYNIDETKVIKEALPGVSSFAYNYKSFFVPFPLLPEMLGPVSSGLLTLSHYDVQAAERVALPVPFNWPVRLFNLKRCLLVNRLPVQGSEHELVLVNLHLEAYDDGTGKKAQTEQLRKFMQAEYDKGNYVIAAGDFNQCFFPINGVAYPAQPNPYWVPGELDPKILPEGWTAAVDPAKPSCRLNSQPYRGNEESTPTFLIDGILLSPNVELRGAETVQTGFRYSDHQPLWADVQLKQETP